MRADRLIAVLLLLQRRGRMTVAQVAAELETSQRTARRDLEALSLAGVPAYSTRGKGGGWQLVGGARTDLTGLTAPEAQALLLTVGQAAADPTARAGLRKLLAALPAPWRDDAERAAGAILVDSASWGAPPSADPPALAGLLRAVVGGDEVELGYRGPGGPSSRVLCPLGLVNKDSRWYLVADTADGPRTFRIDRVTAVTPTGRAADRPADFDLRLAWAARRRAFEEHRHAEHALALVHPDALPRLRALLAHRLEEGAPGPDGRIVVAIVGPVPEVTALELAGFGARVEFTDPAARRQLRSLAAELSALYGPPADRG